MDVLSWHRHENLSNKKKKWGKRVFEFVMETDSTDADNDNFLDQFCLVVALVVVREDLKYLNSQN